MTGTERECLAKEHEKRPWSAQEPELLDKESNTYTRIRQVLLPNLARIKRERYLSTISTFLVVVEEHSIGTVREFELLNPLRPVQSSLDGHSGHFGPVSKIHLKPLLPVM